MPRAISKKNMLTAILPPVCLTSPLITPWAPTVCHEEGVMLMPSFSRSATNEAGSSTLNSDTSAKSLRSTPAPWEAALAVPRNSGTAMRYRACSGALTVSTGSGASPFVAWPSARLGRAMASARLTMAKPRAMRTEVFICSPTFGTREIFRTRGQVAKTMTLQWAPLPSKTMAQLASSRLLSSAGGGGMAVRAAISACTASSTL